MASQIVYSWVEMEAEVGFTESEAGKKVGRSEDAYLSH